jgi:hypothetical protein
VFGIFGKDLLNDKFEASVDVAFFLVADFSALSKRITQKGGRSGKRGCLLKEFKIPKF